MALFSRKPKVHTCFFCSTDIDDVSEAKAAHYESHLIKVTDDNGHEAYTFECPRCGLMDQAWGGGRPDPKLNAYAAITVHLMERHGDHSLLG